MKPLVIYHAHCTDGFAAAFAAWCKLGDTAEYVPAHYGSFTWPNIKGRDVYILDFSFPKAEMTETFRQANNVVWLDHHKTSFDMWCPQPSGQTLELFTQSEIVTNSKPVSCRIVLDNNKSGAMLAWEHFHPDVEVPFIIKCIDDRDRWVFAIPESKAIHAGLQMMQPWDFNTWADYWADADVLIAAGKVALAVQGQQVARLAKQAAPCKIIPGLIDSYDSYKAPWLWNMKDQCTTAAGLSVNTSTHISEVGAALATKSGTFGLVWYFDGKTKRANCSLRSNGDYDVSLIAKAFGGGGHKNAAGFNVDVQVLLSWLTDDEKA